MSEDYRQTLSEIDDVLDGVRSHLLKIFAVFIVGTGLGYLLSFAIINEIRTQMLSRVPSDVELVWIGPLEIITVQIKISIIIGLLIALPLIFYYLYGSINEKIDRINLNLNLSKKQILVIVVAAILLFLAGVLYSYFLMTPLMFKALVILSNMIDPGIAITYTISKFINLVVLMVLAFGITFEFPIILNLAIRSGLVKYKTVKEKRKIIYLLILILSGLVTGPTIITQVMIALPLFLFFEISLYISKYTT
ncbi:MAG: Sec-independent protein secretion pathway component TatC [Candidatus Methanohalarchaeum thermophilum]|uniref:Sec-independent protein translocase protein TatC n=1 Tax=Methanohalarchaeum thermophilum TaxID=1903181 RepID=A0A1Q6DUI5_METT1|nr:MAG: Sec-independent protein secretion pathway component TatC [Candidatus Methanohalarchaeum thermophilum]